MFPGTGHFPQNQGKVPSMFPGTGHSSPISRKVPFNVSGHWALFPNIRKSALQCFRALGTLPQYQEKCPSMFPGTGHFSPISGKKCPAMFPGTGHSSPRLGKVQMCGKVDTHGFETAMKELNGRN